jgi:hypothetical protein
MVDLRHIIALGLAASACNSDPETQSILLEQLCSQPPAANTGIAACTLEGDAQRTSGLTADSTAIRLGPSSGALRIRLNLFPVAQQQWSLEALAAARPLRPEGNLLFRSIDFGSCDAVTCPDQPPDTQAPLSEDFQWAVMVESLPGSATPGTVPPDDASLILRGADIDILELRSDVTSSNVF